MHYKTLIILVLIAGCSSEPKKQPTTSNSIPTTEQSTTKEETVFNWTGYINKTIPVFLHYALHDKLIVGEITYLNTKDRKPIRILGNIEKDESYRLLEFEPDGNVSGIITGNPDIQSFNGGWFSPKTRKDLNLNLLKKDTSLAEPDIKPDMNNIYGNYHYQYTEEGHQGDCKIERVSDNKITFNIFSVTGAPARNIADVPIDTVPMTTNSFIYKIPGTDSCEFKVTFYKYFLTIDYTKGYCDGQFGNNATIDGIFLKVLKK